MYEVDHRYLKFVDFSSVESWSSYSILGRKLDYTKQFPFVKIGKFLKRNKTAIKIEDAKAYKRATIKINGNGIFLRDEVLGNVIGTKNQFLITAKQFLLSKIDARNGAFGVVPNELDGGIITGNFWTFDVDYSIINPHFLTLITKTKAFQNLCQAASVGTTNRNYLQERDFLNFQIPLPSIAEQKAILDDYQQKIENAKQQETKAQTIEQSIEKYLFEELGIVEDSISNGFGLKIIEYKSLERWDGKSSSSFNSKFSTVKVSELIKKISTGTTPPTNIKEYFEGDINFYAPSDLGKEMYLFNAERNISQKAIDDKKARVFEKNTLLFVGIGSTVGKVGIIGNDYATSNQQITGLNFNNRIFVEYAYYYFNYFTSVTIKEKTQATIPIVNQDKILNIPIPLPPLEKQKEIAKHISAIKDNIKSLKQNAETLKAEAEKEFEEKIFN